MLMPLPNGALMSVAPNDSILMQFDVRVDARWEGYCHRQTGLTVAAFLVCQCARELKREVLFKPSAKSELAAAPLGGAPSVPHVSARGDAGWTV